MVDNNFIHHCELCANKCFFCMYCDDDNCSKHNKLIKSVLNHTIENHHECEDYQFFDIFYEKVK